MRPELAQATMQFMRRVNLNAEEIPTFQACCAALSQEAQPQEHPNENEPSQTSEDAKQPDVGT